MDVDVFVSFELSGKLRDARLVLLDEMIFECFMVILVVQSYVKRYYRQAPVTSACRISRRRRLKLYNAIKQLHLLPLIYVLELNDLMFY